MRLAGRNYRRLASPAIQFPVEGNTVQSQVVTATVVVMIAITGRLALHRVPGYWGISSFHGCSLSLSLILLYSSPTKLRF
jgi:hypothetical protein